MTQQRGKKAPESISSTSLPSATGAAPWVIHLCHLKVSEAEEMLEMCACIYIYIHIYCIHTHICMYIYIYPDGFALDPTQNACFSVNRHACHCFVLCFNLFFLTVWKRPFRAPFFKLKRGTYHFLPRLPMFCTMFQLLCLTKNARFLECKKGFVTMFVVGVL